jgi:DNA-binding NtrC family response regulator
VTPPIIPIHDAPRRLLLVDDDVLLLETLQELLTAEGFQVVTASNAEAAEHFLQAARPPYDLVITDLVMPGRSGMDVLRTALKLNPGCTVLVMSGYGTVKEATEAMDLGAYGLVNKPLQMDPFRQTLRRIHERTSLVRERDALKGRVEGLQARVDALEAIQGRMEMMAQRMNPLPAAHADTLQDLGALHAAGLLSDEQFAAAKQFLLAKWLP